MHVALLLPAFTNIDEDGVKDKYIGTGLNLHLNIQ